MARKRKAVASINMVPMIDIMLVLLIIFMITAPMVQTGQVDLPSLGQAQSPQAPPLEVDIDARGAIHVRDTVGGQEEGVLEGDLVSYVQRKQADKPDRPVVIAADKNIRYEVVMHVMDLLQTGGVKKIGLLAKNRAG